MPPVWGERDRTCLEPGRDSNRTAFDPPVFSNLHGVHVAGSLAVRKKVQKTPIVRPDRAGVRGGSIGNLTRLAAPPGNEHDRAGREIPVVATRPSEIPV